MTSPAAAAALIDEYSSDGTGWARFSADRKYRYRLGRLLSPRTLTGGWADLPRDVLRVVFLMLNPSTADAFKLDPTVKRCARFAARWGADVLEVVNLFAFRSPHPKSLRELVRAGGDPIGPDNDAAILAACRRDARVIAAWGLGGELGGREEVVTHDLLANGINLECLATTGPSLAPRHPLARGVHWIPDDQEPRAWP